MTPLALTITQAGLAKFAASAGGADIDLTIATVGVTSRDFVVAPTLTNLPGIIKHIDTVSGEVTSADVVHLTCRDESTDTYSMLGFGLFLADGTLFAVYGQATAIMQKSPASTLMIALDLKFPSVDITQITFGDTNFLNPPATETVKGVAYIATQALVDAGVDDYSIVSPKKLAVRLSAAIANFVSGSRKVATSGLATGGGDLTADRTINVPAASGADAVAGTSATLAMTPAADLAALDARLGAGSPTTFIKTLLASASVAAARTVLGLGGSAVFDTASSADTIAGTRTDVVVTPSGSLAALDARFGAGNPTTYIKTLLASASAAAARTVLGLGNVATLAIGAGNGIDADKLDGHESAEFVLKTELDQIGYSDRTTAGSDTVTVPAWARQAEVHIVGAGGGGGGSGAAFSGGGGGAGGYVFGVFAVTPGATLNRTVGAGGVGASGGNIGSTGGTSSLGGYSATGGSGGQSSGTTCAGGAGGTGAGGLRGFNGGQGGDGNAQNLQTQGGNGAAGPFGGQGRTGAGTGVAATAPGAGGGGSWNSAGGTGGAGADGAVLIRWLP